MTISHSIRRNARETILDAAEAVVGERGALSLTLDAVADRAGVSKGGLLYHFPTKDALLRAMVDRLCRGFEARTLEQMSKNSTPRNSLEAYIAATLDRHASGSVASGLLAAIANDPELLAPMREHLRRWLPQLDPARRGFTDRAIIWLATEGLWLLDILKLSPLSRKQRPAIAERLSELARGKGIVPIAAGIDRTDRGTLGASTSGRAAEMRKVRR